MMPLFRAAMPVLAAWLLLVTMPAYAGSLSIVSHDRWVRVAWVYDGDTFRTDTGEKVRLLGINTPEVMHGDEPGEVFGERARQRLQSLVLGRIVRLSFDRQRTDPYGRTLAQVHLGRRWINALLLEEGLAHVYTFTPNLRWTKSLLAHERHARQRRIGIWATPRFRVLRAQEVGRRHIGQFRLVRGHIRPRGRWRWRMGRLRISVPRKVRHWFRHPPELPAGTLAIVRGRIRADRHGRLFLALHTPYDLEVLR